MEVDDLVGFKEFPKIPRLNRDIIITEKIDGTNAAVLINFHPEDSTDPGILLPSGAVVRAQSRNRLLSPEKDNFGFARWVFENAELLATILGEGRHFGEWWGAGIQRGYGLKEKRFSLFNTSKWGWLGNPLARADKKVPDNLRVVPTLYSGPWFLDGVAGAEWAPEFWLASLRAGGSVASPGAKAEGIVVFHEASGYLFKATCEGDEKPKGVK